MLSPKSWRSTSSPYKWLEAIPSDQYRLTGPLIYILKGKQEGKAYMLAHSFSLTRAVYIDLTRGLKP